MPRSRSKYGAAVVPFVAVLLAASCHAADVYKCKGSKGELIYQNLPCPNGTKPIATGRYDPAPDDPRQAIAAANEAERIRFERGQQTTVVPTNPGADQRARNADAASAAMRDSRSIAGRQAIKEAANSQAAQDAKYRAAVKRWGKRLAGQPPMGYVAAPPPPQPRDTFAEDRLRQMGAPEAPATPPAYITSCTQPSSATVYCNKSDGSVEYGGFDLSGNGSVQGKDGHIELIRNDPFGHPKTENGTCVKDLYGQCQ